MLMIMNMSVYNTEIEMMSSLSKTQYNINVQTVVLVHKVQI